MTQLLSVLVPMYNEQEVISETNKRLVRVLSSLDMDYEIIYINDGSRDRTMEIAKAFPEENERIRIIDFSRNFGHQLAVTAGLDEAKGDAIVIIDADLQDPPELIPKMVEMWRGGAEVVYGKRRSRQGENFLKKLTAFCYYRTLNALSGWKIPNDTGDFRLMDRRVADVMREMPEHNRFLRGMISWVGFNQVPLEFEREERFAGETKYTLKKMLKLASDGIFSFSGKPFAIIRWTGRLLLSAGLILLLVMLIANLCGGAFVSWRLLLYVMLTLCGLLMLSLGVCGVYFERMYDELKGRPLYIIRKIYGKKEK